MESIESLPSFYMLRQYVSFSEQFVELLELADSDLKEISNEEMRRRLETVKPKEHPDITRGFVRNFIDNTLQTNEGCDLRYL